jgi:methionine-rich copper-binding protein CopC
MSRARYALVAGNVALLLTFALATAAFAHASYVSSIPNANSTVSRVPSTLVAKFAESIVPSTASLTITGPNGARADQGDGHVDLNDPSRQTMRVSLKSGLGPGTYTVHWHTVSGDDGDPDSGTFVFTVAQPAAPSGGQSAATGPASLPQTGGPPIAPVLVAGLVAVGAGVSLRRRGG